MHWMGRLKLPTTSRSIQGRAFELILKHYGTCRAITNFSQYPVEEGRADCAQLLAQHVHLELLANVSHAVAEKEGQPPEGNDLAAVVDGREWLFEGNAYYLDTSHVSSLVPDGSVD